QVCYQLFVSGHVKTELFHKSWWKESLRFVDRRFDQPLREICTIGALDTNPLLLERRNEVNDVHASSAAEFQQAKRTRRGGPQIGVHGLEIHLGVVVSEQVVNPVSSRARRIFTNRIFGTIFLQEFLVDLFCVLHSLSPDALNVMTRLN